MPSRNDSRNDTGATCGVCGEVFTPLGRRRWCSDACRQAAWRRRQPTPPPPLAAFPPARSRKDTTVYECPECDTRQLGVFSSP